METTKLSGQPNITPLNKNNDQQQIVFNNNFEKYMKQIQIENKVGEQKRIQELNNNVKQKTLMENNTMTVMYKTEKHTPTG